MRESDWRTTPADPQVGIASKHEGQTSIVSRCVPFPGVGLSRAFGPMLETREDKEAGRRGGYPASAMARSSAREAVGNV
jgi:hypothetical protein